MDATDSQIQNLTSKTFDQAPFDERVLQTQNNISQLQDEAMALISRQRDLLVIYDELLFAINTTLRNEVAQINGSLDVLKRVFTTVYVTTFTAQELMQSLVSEFEAALTLVMQIESIDLPVIRGHSEAIQADAMNVSVEADELDYILANSSTQIEGLRNATYEILRLSSSILTDAATLITLQDGIRSDIERIASTYGDLDSDIDELDLTLTGFEMDLIDLTNRLQMKRNTLVEVPSQDGILSLTRNANETESFVRNDIITEIVEQTNQFRQLNESYTAQRGEFEALYQEIVNLGVNVSSLLEMIQAAHSEAVAISEDAQDLVRQAEMVADNLESFDNETFEIGREVAEAVMDIDELNRNASEELVEAQRLQEELSNTSESIRSAKELANIALETANNSLEVCSYPKVVAT